MDQCCKSQTVGKRSSQIFYCYIVGRSGGDRIPDPLFDDLFVHGNFMDRLMCSECPKDTVAQWCPCSAISLIPKFGSRVEIRDSPEKFRWTYHYNFLIIFFRIGAGKSILKLKPRAAQQPWTTWFLKRNEVVPVVVLISKNLDVKDKNMLKQTCKNLNITDILRISG